jgi:hypothetical protein
VRLRRLLKKLLKQLDVQDDGSGILIVMGKLPDAKASKANCSSARFLGNATRAKKAPQKAKRKPSKPGAAPAYPASTLSMATQNLINMVNRQVVPLFYGPMHHCIKLSYASSAPTGLLQNYQISKRPLTARAQEPQGQNRRVLTHSPLLINWWAWNSSGTVHYFV